MKTAFIILLLIPFGILGQRNTGFEFHGSVNLPLNQGKSLFGAGVGANILLRDTCRFNFKTGIEVNYFQTWDESAYFNKVSSKRNVNYRFTALTFPVFARFTFGKRVKWFLEAGVYTGFGVGGEVTYNVTGMYPNAPLDERTESCSSGLSITPAGSLGFRFPLSKRIDLLLKPEFAYVRNKLQDMQLFADKNKPGKGYGGSYEYDFSYMYVRFCAGIHLKPKPRKSTAKSNVIKIEPLY